MKKVNEQLLKTQDIKNYNLSMGIKDNLFYYGKTIERNNKLIEIIILSNKEMLSNQSKLSTKDDPLDNDIKNYGINYNEIPINLEKTCWSNESINKFLLSKNKLIDNNNLFIRIYNQIIKYMDVYDNKIVTMLTCWILGTYIYNEFESYGYILLTSQKSSGKTKLLNILGLLSRNSISVSSPSESALFRIINGNRITLLIDDFETFKNDDKTRYILQLLKIGFEQNGRITRNIKYKDDYIPKLFNVYCPKILTNTTSLDPITISRCITINLLPTKTNKGKIKPNKKNKIWQEIIDDCHIFIMENYKEILNIYENYEFPEFNSRELDLTKGLLSIAKLINEDTYKQTVDYLKDAFYDRDLQDLSSDWEYLLFKKLLETIDTPRWCSLSEMNNLLKEEVYLEPNKKFNQYIRSRLSKLTGLFKKKRFHEGIMYFIDPKNIKEYMDLKDYPYKKEEILEFKGKQITKLKEPIMDTCVNCNEQKYVLYTTIEETGKNYCEGCVACEHHKVKNEELIENIY